MACTLQDISAAPRVNRPKAQLKSKPTNHGYTIGLGRALLLCRTVVKSVELFMQFPLALLLLIIISLSLFYLTASPLLLFLQLNIPIRAFIVHKLHNAVTFGLLTSIVLLSFLCKYNYDTSAEEARPAALCMRKSKRKAKKKTEFNSSMDYDLTTLISEWLFESTAADEYSNVSDAKDLIYQEDEALCILQPQLELAAVEEHTSMSARTPQSTPTYKLPLQIDGSAAAKTNNTVFSSEVHQIQTKANYNKHSRSRSYASGLNLHDNTADSSSAAAAYVPAIRRRRASVSCDRGSTESYSPLLQNTHADLRSPPLPPFAINIENGSKSSSDSTFVRKSELAPGRVSSPVRTHKQCHEKAAESVKPQKIIDYDEVFNRNVTSAAEDELQKQADAFIAKRQEQWRLESLK